MIPTSTQGHMPFISNHNGKRPTNITNGRMKTISQTYLQSNSRNQTSPRSGCISPISPNCSTMSNKFMDLSTGTPVLSRAGREEVLKRDRSWKAFLKIFFRSKQKEPPSKLPVVTELTIPKPHASASSVQINDPQSRAIRRPRTRQCPLQRSNSLHATNRHIAILEAIIEEESPSHFIEINDFSASNNSLDKILLDPNSLNRPNSTSECISTEPSLPLEQLFQDFLIMSSNVTPDAEQSNDSCMS